MILALPLLCRRVLVCDHYPEPLPFIPVYESNEFDTDVFVLDGRIAPRSGLASKHFIDTGAGVIDADYRGEVKVLLFNHSDVDFPSTST